MRAIFFQLQSHALVNSKSFWCVESVSVVEFFLFEIQHANEKFNLRPKFRSRATSTDDLKSSSTIASNGVLGNRILCFYSCYWVELHPWTEVDTRKQWNPEQLPLEIGAGPCGDSVNLTVKSEALHQGLYIFKRALNNLRREIVQMGGNKSVMNICSFMELPERRKGLNVIFVWLQRSETATYEGIQISIYWYTYCMISSEFASSFIWVHL